MSKFGTFLSGLAGVAVLIGYFFPSFGQKYYLVFGGGILAILSAVLNARSY
jgi:hypothetical protein